MIRNNKNNEINKLNTIREILIRYKVDKYSYSLSGYKDDKICLEKDCDTWKVYYAKRGKREALKSFGDINSAGTELISELTYDDDDAIYDYLKEVYSYKKIKRRK